MRNPIFDYDDGDFIYQTSGNMGIDSDGICICEWVIIYRWTWTLGSYTLTPVGEMTTKTMTSNTV